MQNSTMDKLAVGARFGFGHGNPKGRFVKVSNLYARDTLDNETRPNTDNPKEAADMPVTYHGSERTQR